MQQKYSRKKFPARSILPDNWIKRRKNKLFAQKTGLIIGQKHGKIFFSGKKP